MSSTEAYNKQVLATFMERLSSAIALGDQDIIMQIYNRIGALPKTTIIDFIKDTYNISPIADQLKPMKDDNGVPVEKMNINALAYWLVILHARYLKFKQNKSVVNVYDIENATSFAQLQSCAEEVLREFIDRVPALRRKHPKFMLLDRQVLEQSIWEYLKSQSAVPLDDGTFPYQCDESTIEMVIAKRGPRPELLLGQCGRQKLMEYATKNGITSVPGELSDHELATKITQFVAAKNLMVKPEINKETIFQEPKGFLTTEVVIPSTLKGNPFSFLFHRNRKNVTNKLGFE
uniref:Uncharacterized protein n=1 Tax=Clandestinovirus TaxID=2831644 RepID=A0A8F8KPR8_9VIRU|nr:hypothetical protein KOM_12_281 [Clandestinovirus]